jgi:YggT family protein
MSVVASLIHRLFQLLTVLVVIDVVLSYFMSPFHPVRQFLDRIVEPMLAPIRRILPQTGMIDFSPLVLIILLQVIDVIVNNILMRF